MRTLPSAAARLARRPVALLAILIISAIASSASQIGSSANARITAEVNAHWRGAYDILVRPSGARLGLETTNGLVEPNFVALGGGGGIRQSQVDAIRRIQGVQLAAPIGWVGLVTTPTTAPSVEITQFPDKPTLYSATFRVLTGDGLGPRPVLTVTMKVFVAPAETPGGQPTVLSNAGDVALAARADGGWVAHISLGHAIPQLQSPVLAVDPEAERALLGDAGSFLDPLVAMLNRDELTVQTADPALVLPGYFQGSDIAAMKQTGGKALARPVLPILVSARTYAPVLLSIDVDQVGHPIEAVPDLSQGDAAALDQAVRQAGQGLMSIGSNSADWAGSMRAFRTNGIGVAWPGSRYGENGTIAFFHGVRYAAMLAARPGYSVLPGPPGEGRTPAFRIAPLGLVPPGGPSADDWVDHRPGFDPVATQVGTEQSYRALEQVSMPVARDFTSAAAGDAAYVFAPVGEYDLDTLDLPHDPLNYAPFGAYDPPDTQLIADAAGVPVARMAMTPTLNPTGLLSLPPMGIVDIHAAELLRGPAPIDAVRVRVAGIGDYGPEGLAAVERVAGAIAQLGLDVDIVAASSPQTVDVFVPQYNVTGPAATDLGWVQQHWTTLGAAPRVERNLSQTNRALLLLALFAVAVVIASVELVTSSVRTREAGILVGIGWRRRQVIRWQAAESIAAGTFVAVLVGIVWSLAGQHDLAGLIVGAAAGMLFGLFGVVGAWAALRSRGVVDGVLLSRALARPAVTGIRRYAWRGVAAQPLRSLTVIVALGLSAGVIAPAGALLASVGNRVGPTALASALTDRLEPYQLALLGLIVIASLACAFLTFRVDMRSRKNEFLVLAATGWTQARIDRALIWSRAFIALPTALLGAFLAAILAGPIAGGSAPILLVMLVAAIVALATPFVAGRLAAWRMRLA